MAEHFTSTATPPATERILAWACPECRSEIRAGEADLRFGRFADNQALCIETTEDDDRLYLHCRRHCRLLADVPLSAVRTGADRIRERLGRVAS